MVSNIHYCIICIFLFILTSCKSIQYVPVETVKTEYIHTLDSIYTIDSIWIESKVLHDTVYLTKYKYKETQVIKRDTILKADTIPIIKEVEKVIEVNKQKKWQIALEYIGGITCILIIGLSMLKVKKFII